ncbi:glycosidase [Salinibacterium sp. G-O1]|uniref:glycoside hydrolase family 130 protein n=1 Tax=Salinibacterium sp. G-O1 TaxID=3046208 RepID=UPI0024BA678D|nr:glycosidase [Salinibacterium sp. G-O1]MDJ0333883.1 glycosidase [Salinibacterium sp. G-O1]
MTESATLQIGDRLSDWIEVERLGAVMTPDPDDPREAEGVLNPASARDAEGTTWLFPRVVGGGNYSRIGRARLIETDGVPTSVARDGFALEPQLPFEKNARTAGTEDPRITRIDAINMWVMTYAAYGPFGPRIALAASSDLLNWERLGVVDFAFESRWSTDFNLYRNKDALLFPEVVTAPDGQPALAMLHRPIWDLDEIISGAGEPLPAGIEDPRLGIWMSFLPISRRRESLAWLRSWEQHTLVAMPEHEWEQLKIGGGTPPVRVPEGWLTIHHGVRGEWVKGVDQQENVFYSAGAMLFDATDVTKLIGRTALPILLPETSDEREGIVNNVVFPTAIESRAGGFDFFYGMADTRIGAAHLTWRGASA